MLHVRTTVDACERTQLGLSARMIRVIDDVACPAGLVESIDFILNFSYLRGVIRVIIILVDELNLLPPATRSMKRRGDDSGRK